MGLQQRVAHLLPLQEQEEMFPLFFYLQKNYSSNQFINGGKLDLEVEEFFNASLSSEH